MAMLPRVVHAEYRGSHSIEVTFSDGNRGSVDFHPWLNGPIFEPLLDEDYFRRFFVANSTVSWPNGADIAPETLYNAVVSRRLA